MGFTWIWCSGFGCCTISAGKANKDLLRSIFRFKSRKQELFDLSYILELQRRLLWESKGLDVPLAAVPGCFTQGCCQHTARSPPPKTGFWSTILEYFFGVPVPLRNHYEIKVYTFPPGYFKVQKRKHAIALLHGLG